MNKETQKPKMTKEELAKAWKEYYNWLQSVYPVETFDIQGKNGETLRFYRGFNSRTLNEGNRLTYYLMDDEYIQYLEKQKALHMQGEEIPENEKKKHSSKGFIDINKDEKWLNFGIEWDYQGHSYGGTIYENIPHILEMLGISDIEQYELRVYGNSKHDFLKNIDTKKFVARTQNEPNNENALHIIGELAKYPNAMSFSEFNTLIEYAIKSNVPREKIANAINDIL